ncbi:HNH endonuclease [Roseomonas chloroacetimidivorans]|uniref:HNH endonuclease n=1 Tax=Roseomonas chloroacetimidivorans TaxID=1766656 RepID=UPI003C7921FB
MTLPCLYCGHPAEEVDHMVPRAAGGTDDRQNLAPSCALCNGSKGSSRLEFWLRHDPDVLARVRRFQAGEDVLGEVVPSTINAHRRTKGPVRGITLRLPPDAHSRLKRLAAAPKVPVHDLLLEAVNDLFRKNDLPPIA